MYFSSLKDEELQHFHKKVKPVFNMSMTQILNSNLFLTEQVTSETYRIYPLFYADNITSSNKDDKILDNQCIITTISEEETYYSFNNTVNTDNVIIDESVLNIHGLGETLSSSEFNAVVYMLRSKQRLTGTLNFKDTTIITGQYGSYQLLHSDNVVRNNTGFVVSDSLKSNPLTIKLVNPFFDSARYTLTCTVVSITGANIYSESDDNLIVRDSFSVDLLSDTEVELDLTEYSNDSVLLFESELLVTFDVAEVKNTSYNVVLTSNKTNVEMGEDFTLTATLSSSSGVTGYSVQFYDGNTLLGSVLTDNNGEAEFTTQSSVLGLHNYNCKVVGVTGAINISISNLKLDVSSTLPIFTGTQYNRGVFNYSVNGVLKLGDEVLSNRTISLKENNVSIGEVTTGSDGSFSKDLFKEIVPTGSTEVGAEFTNNYELQYTSSYDNTVSTSVDVTPSRNTYLKDISLHQLSEGGNIGGVLYSTSQYMLNNKTITIGLYSSDDELIISKTTVYPHTTGPYGRFSLYFDSADLSLTSYVKIVFNGDTFYNRCEFTGVPTIIV